MGRGRAKAKQTKVARQLKYGGPTTDLERLQAELAGTHVDSTDDEDDEFDEDPYAKYVADDEDDSDEDEPSR
jgi:Protein of unknown function (DUF3073)